MDSEDILNNKENKNFVFFILIVAFMVRLVYVFTLKQNVLYFGDSEQWNQIVLNFLSGKGLIVDETTQASRMPLYSLFLSSVYFIFGKVNLLAVRIIQSLISALTCVIVYFTAISVFRDNKDNKKIGKIAAIISVFYPFFIYYSGAILNETLFIFLISLVILFLTEKKFFIAGIILGLSILCKAETFLFFLFVIGTFFVTSPKKALKISLIITAMVVMVLSPWIARNYTKFNRFVPFSTTGSVTFWEGNNPQNFNGGPCHYFPNMTGMNEIERDTYLKKETMKVIKENPKRFFILSRLKFKRFWNIKLNTDDVRYASPRNNLISMFTFGPVLFLFIPGLLLSLGYRKNFVFIYGFIFCVMLINLIFVSSLRYRLPIEPYLIIFASYSLNLLFLKGQK